MQHIRSGACLSSLSIVFLSTIWVVVVSSCLFIVIIAWCSTVWMCHKLCILFMYSQLCSFSFGMQLWASEHSLSSEAWMDEFLLGGSAVVKNYKVPTSCEKQSFPVRGSWFSGAPPCCGRRQLLGRGAVCFPLLPLSVRTTPSRSCCPHCPSGGFCRCIPRAGRHSLWGAVSKGVTASFSPPCSWALSLPFSGRLLWSLVKGPGGRNRHSSVHLVWGWRAWLIHSTLHAVQPGVQPRPGLPPIVLGLQGVTPHPTAAGMASVHRHRLRKKLTSQVVPALSLPVGVLWRGPNASLRVCLSVFIVWLLPRQALV